MPIVFTVALFRISKHEEKVRSRSRTPGAKGLSTEYDLYVKQTETRAGRSHFELYRASRHDRKSPFFYEYIQRLAGRRLNARCLVRDNDVVSLGRRHVLSARSRVEIDKCRVRTSVTYLTEACDSFGVKKSLRFPARYQLAGAVTLLSLHPPPSLSLSFSLFFLLFAVSHNGLRSRIVPEPVGHGSKVVNQEICVNGEMF